MSKWAAVLTGLLLVGGGVGSAAASVDTRIDLWLGASQFDYKEPGLMSEEGKLLSIGFSGDFDVGPRLTLGMGASFGIGKLDYTGATWGGEPVTTDTDDTWSQLDMTAGYRFGVARGILTPYTGLAFREWRQELHDATLPSGNQSIGYERQHKYLYSPLGATFEAMLTSQVSVLLRAEYRLIHEATAEVGFEDTPEMDISGGHGTSFAVRIEHRQFPLWLEAYTDHWSLPDSDVVQMGETGLMVYEPNNETDEVGLRIGYRW